MLVAAVVLPVRGLMPSSITLTAALPACLPLLLFTTAAACQVTDAIKQYVEEKVTKAVHNYTQNIKKIDVTLSARGGDTGTHGAK
jgi:hypothetical protein